jgi:VWFA-related protein
MLRRLEILSVLFAGLVSPCIRPTLSQSPQLIPRTHEERERSYQNLHRIVLNVAVSDFSGKPITDLVQSDFVLLRDHQVQPIALFRPPNDLAIKDHPRVILVMDSVNNSSGKVALFRKQIAKFLNGGTGPLAQPVAIASFSEAGLKVGTPSPDRAALVQALTDMTGDIQTTTCADTIPALQCSAPKNSDGFSPCDPNPRLQCLNHLFNSSITALTSLAQEQMDKQGRVILIWFGRGWPLLNEHGYIPDTPEVQQTFFRNFVNISNALTEAQITLDAIALSDPLPIAPKYIRDSFFYRGVADASHAVATNLSLQALSYQSGGLVLTTSKDIAGQIARCIADAGTSYQLAFDVSPSTLFGEYHSIELKLKRFGFTVRTRTLYFAEQ